MLAPLPSVEAFRRDAVSDGVELDDGVAAGWLESATRLERAAMTRGPERERLLAGLLAQHGVVNFRDSATSPTAPGTPTPEGEAAGTSGPPTTLSRMASEISPLLPVESPDA